MLASQNARVLDFCRQTIQMFEFRVAYKAVTAFCGALEAIRTRWIVPNVSSNIVNSLQSHFSKVTLLNVLAEVELNFF